MSRGPLLLLAAAVLTSGEGAAQELSGPPDPEDRHPGESLRVQVLTAAPGEAIWERFGHNAIRIVDEARGTDVAWNWGLFSFEEDDFMVRLIQGTMRYWMGGVPTDATLEAYRADGRTVWVQELDLPPEARWEMQQAILENSLPANRFYRYDYYRDNCSTRVRDMIDLALGGDLRERFAPVPTGTTYRDHTRRLLQGVWWGYTGIQVGLGPRTDRPITAWEEMFLPVRLREHLNEMTVVREGQEVPLVRSESRVLTSPGDPVPDRVPHRLPLYLVVGLGLAAITGGLATGARAGGWLPRAAFTLLAGAWSLASGALGLTLVGAWLFTDHVFWFWNENLVQTNPLAILVAVGLPVLLVRRALPPWVAGAAVAVAVLSVAGFVGQVVPGLDQANGEVIALWMPMNVAVAWGAVRLGGRSEDRGTGGSAPVDSRSGRRPSTVG